MEKIFETTFQLVLAVVIQLCMLAMFLMSVFAWKSGAFISLLIGLICVPVYVVVRVSFKEWKEARL